MNSTLSNRVSDAKAALRNASSVIVAVSGGVDSAVLLALAVQTLGSSRVLAVTGASAAVPEAEIEDARRLAAALGARHEAVGTREIERPGYRANAGERCYHCRLELFELLEQIRFREDFGAVAYGAIADDLADVRPGMRAATERRILAPLLDAGLTKDDVRVLARQFGLDVQDKPASPCLASRIPIGSPVTAAKLAQIDRAESSLKALGFREFRVRHHGEIARLELDEDGHGKLSDLNVRETVVGAVEAAGFRFVTVDPAPFKSGGAARAVSTPLYSIVPAPDKGQ